jgi:type I restriction enzyme S subunit
MRYTNKSLLVSKELRDIIVSTGFVVLRVRDTKKLLPAFLSFLVSSNEFQKRKDALGHGATQQAINVTEDLPKLNIPLSSLDIQRKTVEELTVIRQRMNRINDLLGLYENSIVNETLFSDTFPKKSLESLIVGDPQNGLYKPKTAYGPNGTPIVRIDNIYDTKFITDPIERVELTQEELETYLLRKGDIILNRVNSDEYLGKCCVYNDEFPECVFESNMMRFRVNDDIALPQYVVYYLTGSKGRTQILARKKPAVNQSSVNQGDIKAIEIPTPNLDMQRTIIEESQKQIATLDQLRGMTHSLEEQIQNRLAVFFPTS